MWVYTSLKFSEKRGVGSEIFKKKLNFPEPALKPEIIQYIINFFFINANIF